MQYAANIFCANKLGIDSPNSGTLGKMARVQRQLMLQITGALCSTATDTLNIATDLLPFKLLVKKTCFRAMAHLATLPPIHPLYHPINSKLNYNTKHHLSPLQHLRHVFNFDTAQVGKIDYLRANPHQTPQIPVRIDEDKEDAVWSFLLRPFGSAQIFTDGSGFGDSIGAAAILRKDNKTTKALQFHLGPATQHTVYEGELVGILLALHMVARNTTLSSIIIYTDNQAALLALNANNAHPDSYLMDNILERLSVLTDPSQRKPQNIQFQWLPAHIGIPGNEDADSFAKEASLGTTSLKAMLPRVLHQPLPLSKSALLQQYAHTLHLRHAALWQKYPRAARLNLLHPDAPSARYRKVLKKLPRKHASLLTQLRTEHIPLQAYLACIKKAESAICPHCHSARETVHHFILRCPAYNAQQNQFLAPLGYRARQLPLLLSKEEYLPALMKFIGATTRFSSQFGHLQDLPEPEKKTRKRAKQTTLPFSPQTKTQATATTAPGPRPVPSRPTPSHPREPPGSTA